MDEREFRYHRRLQNAVDFIEKNLKEEMSLQEVSAAAFTSLYHFHRLFRAFTGRGLAEYIRERRLTAAAFELVSSTRRVLDIALDYRYSSPESFLRAFKARYDMTPREFRRTGMLPPSTGRIDLCEYARGSAEGRMSMTPRIVEREALRIFGTRIRTRHGSCGADVSRLWNRLRKGGSDPDSGSGPGVDSVYGVCFGACSGCSCTGEESRPGESFSYFVGYGAPEAAVVPDGTYEAVIPAGRYAVFSVAAGKMRETMDEIYASWLPASGFELGGSPVLEKYGPDWKDAEDAEMEVWLPVRSGV